MANTNYRPEIDGLRALAITPVVLFHLFPEVLPNGFLGVDVFFVISGYLITGILLRELQADAFSIFDFWGRRIRRLFPVLAIVVITTHIFAFFALFGDEWVSLTRQSLAALTSTANLFYWRIAGDYWGPTAESMPLLHTWSLAVEEQFYLLYPPVLSLLHRTTGPTKTRKIIICATVVSFLLMAVMSRTHKAAAFYLLPTRAWELLIGCLLAFQHTGEDRSALRASRVLRGLGVLLVLGTLCLPISATDYRLVQTAIAITGTAIVLHSTSQPGATSVKWLESAPVVFLGKISYSWYMWHWPLIVLAPKLLSVSPALILGATVIAAAASWRFIENTTRFLPRMSFVLTSTTILLLACFSLTTPYILNRPAVNYSIPKTQYEVNIQPPYIARLEQYTGDWRSGLTVGPPNSDEGKSVILIGDSHGVMYFPAVLAACRNHDLVLTSFAADGGTWPFFVRDGTNPSDYYHAENSPGGWTPETRIQFDELRRNFMSRNTPRAVVICGRWSFYHSRLRNTGFRQYFLDLLQQIPESAKVLIIGQPPTLPFGASGLISGQLDIPPYRAIAEDSEELFHRQSAHSAIRQLAADDARIVFVPVDSVFETSRGLMFLDSGTILYRDNDHLNSVGSLKCTELISAALRGLLR